MKSKAIESSVTSNGIQNLPTAPPSATDIPSLFEKQLLLLTISDRFERATETDPVKTHWCYEWSNINVESSNLLSPLNQSIGALA